MVIRRPKGAYNHFLLVLASLWLLVTSPASAQNLVITFLDVGQGDATLIRSGSCAALIDAGGGRTAAGRLRQLGVGQLAFLIASHNHRDHIGGVGEITRSAKIGLYVHNGVPERSQTQRFTRIMLDRQDTPQRVASLDTLTCGHARLIVGASPLVGVSEEQNDLSLIVRVEFGEFSALFTGDSGFDQIHAMIESGWAEPATLLKAAHHGARDGVTPEWLNRIKPSVVVISVGAANGYGHPELSALRYYLAGSRKVYRTDRDGEVTIQVARSGSLNIYAEFDTAGTCDRQGRGCAWRRE